MRSRKQKRRGAVAPPRELKKRLAKKRRHESSRRRGSPRRRVSPPNQRSRKGPRTKSTPTPMQWHRRNRKSDPRDRREPKRPPRVPKRLVALRKKSGLRQLVAPKKKRGR